MRRSAPCVTLTRMQADADANDAELLVRRLEGAAQRPLETARQVFVNRDLPLEQVNVVGFDMDYTLAIYRRLPMEQLQYDLTLQKLIQKKGYPEDIRTLPYEPAFVIRGLVVDKARGNILKLDAFGTVGRAFHGKTRLTPEQQRDIYRQIPVRLSNTRRFASLDTLFSLPETSLFANILEFMVARARAGQSVSPLEPTEEFRQTLAQVLVPGEHAEMAQNPPPIHYIKLFDDVRECIDEAHRDGSLKTIIKQDVGRYIFPDPELPPTLHKLRSSGKRLFLLTNSLWDYTHHVMSFLLEGQLPEYPSWRHYFDAVIVGAGKPRFFQENQPFLEVDPQTGTTRAANGPRLERGHIYQGGNIREFEARMGASGDNIMYVGDHIYGDILRSKKNSLWRTALVVQELEDEIRVLENTRDRREVLSGLDRRLEALGSQVNTRKALLARLAQEGHVALGVGDVEPEALAAAEKVLRRRLDQDKRELRAVAAEGQALESALANEVNPYWGMVFKEAHELSRFGEQVDDYACIYTSRVSNLLYYSPMHHFRAARNDMHHERVVLGPTLDGNP